MAKGALRPEDAAVSSGRTLIIRYRANTELGNAS